MRKQMGKHIYGYSYSYIAEGYSEEFSSEHTRQCVVYIAMKPHIALNLLQQSLLLLLWPFLDSKPQKS